MKTLKIRVPSSTQLIYYMFLLSVFNLFLVGPYIALVSTVFLIFCNRKVIIDNTFVLLCTFAITYAIFSIISGSDGVLTSARVLVFPCSYYLGRYLPLKKEPDTITRVVVDIAIFMAMHTLLNLLYNFFMFGLSFLNRNTFYDIFSKSIAASTGQMAYTFIFCSIISYLMLAQYSKYKKFVFVILYICLAIYNFALGGRTFILLSAVSIIVGLFIYLRKKKNIVVTTKYLTIVSIAILALVLAYNYNLLGIKSFIENSFFYARFWGDSIHRIDFFSDARFDIKKEFYKSMWDYPFGGGHLSQNIGFYAHELWLDTYDIGGIMPYCIIIIYTFSSGHRFYNYYKNKLVEGENAMLMISFYVGIIVSFFLEPIISGAPFVLMAYCFIDGIISKYEREQRNGSPKHVEFRTNTEYRI